jgi:hypothetical protein
MFSQKCLDRNPAEATQVMRAITHYKTLQTERINSELDAMSAEEKKIIRSLRGMLEFGQVCAPKSDIKLLVELGNTLPYEAAIMKATASLVVFLMDHKSLVVDWADTVLPCDPTEFARLLKFIVESEDHAFDLVFNLPKQHWFNGKVVEAEYNKLTKYGTGDARVSYNNAVLGVAKTNGTGVMTMRQHNYPALPDITRCTLGNMGDAILFGKFLSTQKSAQKIPCSPDFLASLSRSLVRCVIEGIYKEHTAAGMAYFVVNQELCLEPTTDSGLIFIQRERPKATAEEVKRPVRELEKVQVTRQVKELEKVREIEQEPRVTDKKNLTGEPCGHCGVVNKEGRAQCFRCKAVLKK